MNKYWIEIDGGQGGSCVHEASSIYEASAYAEEWARAGDWDTSAGTVYCDVRVTREGDLDDDGEDEEENEDEENELYFTVSIHPHTECDGDENGEHDWQSPLELVGGCEENPGVFGHGGGCFITEVCSRCGTYRITDTWASHPETGEQGFTLISYRDADEESLEWINS